jgi:hypothetical protein
MDHAGVSPMRSGSGLCGRCASGSPAHLPIGDGPSRQALPVPRSDPAHRTPPQNGVVLVVATAHRSAPLAPARDRSGHTEQDRSGAPATCPRTTDTRLARTRPEMPFVRRHKPPRLSARVSVFGHHAAMPTWSVRPSPGSCLLRVSRSRWVTYANPNEKAGPCGPALTRTFLRARRDSNPQPPDPQSETHRRLPSLIARTCV